VFGSGLRSNGGLPGSSSPVVPLFAPPDVSGTIRIAQLAENGEGPVSLRQVTMFLNGDAYHGMEDNDLRGFLDGGFYLGWNQPTQGHVRIGRVGYGHDTSAPPGRPPVYGEHELFRVIQRWDGISLPIHARVNGCRLILAVDDGCEYPLRVMLYEVRKDWNPGSGGVHGNNVSVPRVGEVWWNDVAYGENPWALPGAGFASREHPDADTDAMPLADQLYEPGDSEIAFHSPRLDDCVSARISTGKPLLFLLKLSDYHEDIPGAQLAVYSGNHGDSHDSSRRPRLIIDWEVPCRRLCLEERVHLEYGRTLVLPRVAVEAGAVYGLSFEKDAEYREPLVELRHGEGDQPSPWQRALRTFTAIGDWVEVRLVAASDPIVLGQPFTAEVRNSWVVSGAPADQVLRWVFISPTGEECVTFARYEGGFTWKVHFLPNAIGPWRYYWSHNFGRTRFVSSVGRLDVIGGDGTNVRAQLDVLAEEIRVARRRRSSEQLEKLRVRFAQLQRAAMQLQQPETFRSSEGDDLRRRLQDIRSLLWGRKVPDPIPMKSMPLRWEVDGKALPEPIPFDVPPASRWRLKTVKQLLRRVVRRAGLKSANDKPQAGVQL